MSDRLNWEKDGRDWPNREASRFVEADGLYWHVQVMGRGPVLLLLHGTGATTHSWRDLAPPLAENFTIVAPDLPGHGFTRAGSPAQFSLPGMARAVDALLTSIDSKPAFAAGHSAGAALLARMCLDGQIAPKGLVSLNGALLPLNGLPAHLFSPIAKFLYAAPLLQRLFARQLRDPKVIARLLRDTGSTLDERGLALYRQVAASPGHAAAVLGMMAGWDLASLKEDLPRLRTPLLLLNGANDRTISPFQALRVRDLVPGCEIVSLPGLGHLAHEERPRDVADIIEDFSRRTASLSEQA